MDKTLDAKIEKMVKGKGTRGFSKIVDAFVSTSPSDTGIKEFTSTALKSIRESVETISSK